MGISRVMFDFNDTGTAGDTGPHVMGALMQMHWNRTSGDTGADLRLDLLPKMGDTGDGFTIWNDANSLVSNFTAVPLQPAHASDGFDTGVDQYHHFIFAGDRPRVKLTSQTGASAAMVGRLYLWFVD